MVQHTQQPEIITSLTDSAAKNAKVVFFATQPAKRSTMSRDNWFSSAQQSAILPNSDQAETLALVQHKPLAHRTSDPEAADYDEAAELFVQGLRLARAGDLDAGRAQIATAYLLDGRSIVFVLMEPQDVQTRALCVDLFLLYKLSQATVSDINNVTYGAHVMRVLIAGKLGNDPTEGQNFMAGGMVSINYLLQRVKEQPHLGAHYSQGGALGGCLTLTNLYYQRSCLHMAMGNHKKAIADLTKALSIDPKYSRARDARSSLWASLRLQDEQFVFNEYKQLVSEVHPDQRGLDVAYAWMAYYTLRDAKCGTLAEAKSYYEKSLRASMKNVELYGAHASGPPPIVKLVKDQYVLTMRNPENRQLREDMDVALATGRMADLAIPEGFQMVPVDPIDKKMAHSCLTCGKSAVDTGMAALLKCTRCKQVSYCSKECQKKDWKKHKEFCKSAKFTSKHFASTDHPVDDHQSEPTGVASSLPKDPIDKLSSGYHHCDRMVRELCSLWDKYGEGFATWWGGKNSQEQIRELMDATQNTLPKSYGCSSEQEMMQAKRTIESGLMSGCCVGMDVDSLVGACGCDGRSQHFCNNKLLHLLYSWAKHTEEMEPAGMKICKMMVTAKIFPQIGPDECYVWPPSEQEGNLQITMLSEDAPAEYRKKMQDRVAAGVLNNVSTVTYDITRKGRILALFVKLFDEYQERVRRQPTKNPWERLHGCEHCNRGCQVDREASRCETCTTTWWCCTGCRQASVHGQRCPIGKPMKSVVLFQF